jgi:hypothetical protein
MRGGGRGRYVPGIPETFDPEACGEDAAAAAVPDVPGPAFMAAAQAAAAAQDGGGGGERGAGAWGGVEGAEEEESDSEAGDAAARAAMAARVAAGVEPGTCFPKGFLLRFVGPPLPSRPAPTRRSAAMRPLITPVTALVRRPAPHYRQSPPQRGAAPPCNR